MVSFIAIWLLCLSPVAFLPNLLNRWGWPTLLCVVVAALLAVWSRSCGLLPRWVWIGLMIALTVFVIASFQGKIPLVQLLGRAPRYEGLIVMLVVVAALWLGARLGGPSADSARLDHFVYALTIASLLLAIIAVLEVFGLHPIPSNLVRPGSLAGNASDQGLLGVISVGLLGMIALGTWHRTRHIAWWALIGTSAGVVSVATSASRAALLAFAVVIVALSIWWMLHASEHADKQSKPVHGTHIHVSRAHNRLHALASVGVVVALVMTVVLAVPLTRHRLLGSSHFAVQTIGDRYIMWGYALRLWGDHLWFGVGPNGFMDAAPVYFGDAWFQRAEVGSILDSPHNIVLQIAVTTGIAGLIVFLASIIMLLVTAIRHIRNAHGMHQDILFGALVTFIAGGVALLAQPTSPKTLVPLAVIAGFFLAKPTKMSVWKLPARIILTSVFVAWLSLLLIWTAADGYLYSGEQAATTGNLEKAQTDFQTAQTLRPWDGDVALTATGAMGGILNAGFENAAYPAMYWAQHAVRMLPDSSTAYFDEGEVALSRNNWYVAINSLQHATELSPADPRIHHELGIAFMAIGNLNGARTQLERAVTLYPTSHQSWQALGVVCQAQGDQACAITARAHSRQ